MKQFISAALALFQALLAGFVALTFWFLHKLSGDGSLYPPEITMVVVFSTLAAGFLVGAALILLRTRKSVLMLATVSVLHIVCMSALAIYLAWIGGGSLFLSLLSVFSSGAQLLLLMLYE
jgi:hypothetical protein